MQSPNQHQRIDEKFEYYRKKVGLVLSPIIFFAIYFYPTQILNTQAHALAAIVGLVIMLWLTEAIPLYITGLLIPILLMTLGVTTPLKAIKPFADPIMFLFIGAFILARAIQIHNLDKRLAYLVLTSKYVGGSPSKIMFAFGAVTTFISMWISNTATTAMMFPIGLAIISMLFSKVTDEGRERYATGIMLICSFGSTIGGLATPVGTPTNLIGIGFIQRQLGYHIPFFTWMKYGLPITIILFIFLFLYLNHFCKVKKENIAGLENLLRIEKDKLGRMSRGELNTLVAFSLTIFLWVTPGILALILGDQHPYSVAYAKWIPESVAALIGAGVLFFMPINFKKKQFTLPFRQAVVIDWGVLAMYGGGIALGQMVFETKLAEILGSQLADYIPAGGISLVAISSALATLTSELTSNVSSANMIVPMIIALAKHSGIQAAIAATMASSIGFMLPISTPTNAIVYSSGYIPLKSMIKYGFILDIIGFVTIVSFLYLFY